MDFQVKLKQSKVFFILIMIMVIDLLLGACSNDQAHSKPATKDRTKTNTVAKSRDDWKLPITVPKGEFFKICGWLSERQLVYITNLDQTSTVYMYNLSTGKSDLLYKSEHPIATVQISPSRKYLLIQSSPSTYQSNVTIIDLKGTEILKKSFPSYELACEWNSFDETKLLVSIFNQDWTYKMVLIDLNNASEADVSLPQPFIKWIGKEKIAYLNWNKNNPELFAPVIEKNLSDEKERTIIPSAIYFSAFRDFLLSITVNEHDSSKAAYSFYDNEQKPIYTFSIPQLTNYSDWLVPFYDYSESKKQFYTFRPLASGEADSYSKGFELVVYDLQNKNEKLIMEGMKNEPISLSPSGEACLYGNNLEKMIDLKTKKVYQLIKG
jgi:hypothetical protein